MAATEANAGRARPRWRWLGWIARWVLPLVAAVVIASGIVSFYGQMRVFVPYGPSLAVDLAVLVLEIEHPDNNGFRVVGSTRERQREWWHDRLVGAWNTQPEFDSEFRKVRVRHWTPWAGSHRFPGKSRCSFVSVPLVYVLVLVLVVAVRSWREVIRRRKQGMCAACGYDMRGLAAGTRCPECGLAS